MKKVILIVSALLFIGCIEVQEAQQKTKEPQIVSEISYKIESLPEAQKYRVQFEGADLQTQITRLAKNKNEKSFEVERYEDIVSEDGPVAYLIRDKGREKIITIDVPKDFVIDGDYMIKSEDLTTTHKKLNATGRLYFKAGSRLVTQGQSLSIEVSQVYSEGGRIVTWAEGTTAIGANPGQSGGKIQIKASELIGSLHVEMRGQNGSSGEVWFNTSKTPEQIYNHGTNGGNSGILFVEILNLNAGFVTADFVPGKGGVGRPIYSYFDSHKIIKPSMGDGQDGLVDKSCLIIKSECQNFH